MIATANAKEYSNPIIEERTYTLPYIPLESANKKQTYSVEDIQGILDIGRSAAYELVKNAPFKVLRIGTTIKISKPSFDAWLQ